MIRPILLLSLTPFLAGCGIEELFSPGSSQARHEYQQAGLIQAPAAPETPQPTQVAEIPVPAAVDVTEPAYVAPEPPVPYVPPPPTCQAIYKIVACGPNGETILL